MKFYVQLGKNNEGIYAISPQEGGWRTRYSRMFARRDEDPVPEKAQFEGGDPYFQFKAYVMISRGPLKGAEISVPYLRYRFTEGDEGEAIFQDNDDPKATAIRKTGDFLECIGIFTKNIKFRDNLLPKFDKLAREMAEEGREFTTFLRAGRVEYFAPLPATEDDEPPAKQKPQVVDDDYCVRMYLGRLAHAAAPPK